MRKILAGIAAAALAYCSIWLLSVPTPGGSLIKTIITFDDVDVTLRFIGFLAAIGGLIALSFQDVQIKYEEHRIAGLRDTLAKASKWLEGTEQRHRNLGPLKEQIAATIKRLDALDAPATGLAVETRRVTELLDSLDERFEATAAKHGVGDVAKLVERTQGRVRDIMREIAALERAASDMPPLTEQAAALETRLKALQDRTIFTALDAVRETIARMTDEDEEDSLPSLRKGDPDYEDDGDLEDQIKALTDQLEELADEMESVESLFGRFVELRSRIAGKVAPLAHRAGTNGAAHA